MLTIEKFNVSSPIQIEINSKSKVINYSSNEYKCSRKMFSDKFEYIKKNNLATSNLG